MSKIKVEVSDAINLIRDHHRTIRWCIKQQSRLDRSLEALVAVRVFGYLPIKGDKEGKKVFERAAQRVKEALAADDTDPLHGICTAAEKARTPFDAERHAAELAMGKLVRGLPVWSGWAKGVSGFGAISLGHIIGETGNLSNYATVSKVWKRLGLAVINGHRQGNPGKGASADDWISEAYSPKRRSEVFVMADALFRAQTVAFRATGGGPYRVIYDRRKAYEIERGISLGHAENRARRYMSKSVIADLWSAWRQATLKVKPMDTVPDAEIPPPIAAECSEGGGHSTSDTHCIGATAQTVPRGLTGNRGPCCTGAIPARDDDGGGGHNYGDAQSAAAASTKVAAE